MTGNQKAVFYLPHGPGAYGRAFPPSPSEKATSFGHKISVTAGRTIISPQELSLDVLQPRNFLGMAIKWKVARIWLVDRIRGPLSLIQIVDHRNQSGENPLRGRTPLGDRPRFPDVSDLYVIQDIGLPQRMVTTVGPERFHGGKIADRSEVAALVALCAGYVGMDVVGIGWNDKTDASGTLLGRFVQEVVRKESTP